MGRIAGDAPGYTFRLCRMVNGFPVVTQHGFALPSVSTFIGEVLGKPAGALGWWGYRIGVKGVFDLLAVDPVPLIDASDPDELEAVLKDAGIDPNKSTKDAGDRGNNAHFVLECLAEGFRELAEAYAFDEAYTAGTEYGNAAIAWWDEKVQPYIDSGEITEVISESPIWSLKHQFSGTFDLALKWGPHPEVVDEGWEVLDAKTHKPARGFTKAGHGCAYISDVAQIRGYRMGFEEMGLGRTRGQRVVVFRENGKSLEDSREVPESFVLKLRELYDVKLAFEKGSPDE